MKYLLILTLLFFSSSTLVAKQLSPVQKKKQKFRNLVVPAVQKVYNELETQYIETAHYMNRSHKHYRKNIDKLKKEYKVKTDKALLMALKPHPKSIAIAQASMESAWATSRFFREAKNIFGVWSYNKNEPRIAAGETRGTKTIWLRKYDNIEDSIRSYYKTLARSRSYREFRKLKMKTNDPYKLVKKLDHYSEMGALYGEELTKVIKYNKFYLYDK
jgi:Bax protein